MYKTAIRAAPRRIIQTSSINSSRRFISTAPPVRRRSLKNWAARWTLAVGGTYYFMTSNVFAEEPEEAIRQVSNSLHDVSELKEPTLDEIVEEKRKRYVAQRVAEKEKDRAANAALAGEGQAETAEEEGEGGLEGLEEEAGQQGAFNEETGEINWDCPCLGGMAHGPCGEEFKAAFSCFVYSKEDVKGIECIDKFKGMQDCFRSHPEVYADQMDDDDDDEDYEDGGEPQGIENAQRASNPNSKEVPAAAEKVESKKPIEKTPSPPITPENGVAPVPKTAHDAST